MYYLLWFAGENAELTCTGKTPITERQLEDKNIKEDSVEGLLLLTEAIDVANGRYRGLCACFGVLEWFGEEARGKGREEEFAAGLEPLKTKLSYVYFLVRLSIIAGDLHQTEAPAPSQVLFGEYRRRTDRSRSNLS